MALSLSHYAKVPVTYINQTICEGDFYEFGGVKLTEAGTYNDTVANVNGCDSVTCLTLSVQKQSEYKYSWSICEGTAYEFGGKSLTEAGIYIDTTYTADGCINLITELTLTVNAKTYSTLDVTICSGSEFTIFGHTFNESGSYSLNGMNAQGCDSIVTLNLTVSAPVETKVEVSIYEGESYTDENTGRTYETAGVYSDTLQTAEGCDSIYTLYLTVQQPEALKNVSENMVDIFPTYISRGESVTVRGNLGKNATIEVFDAVGKLVTTIMPKDNEVVTIDEFYTSGIYTIHVTDANGRNGVGRVLVK